MREGADPSVTLTCGNKRMNFRKKFGKKGVDLSGSGSMLGEFLMGSGTDREVRARE